MHNELCKFLQQGVSVDESEAQESAVNLPAIVQRVGGALEAVVSEIDRYVDERFPLDRVNLIALSRVIEHNPELNTEQTVGFMVDALSYHGIGGRQRAPFFKLVQRFGADNAALALEYLLDAGYRDRGEAAQSREPKNSLRYVKAVLMRIEDLTDSGISPVTYSHLADMEWRISDYMEEEDYADD